MPAPVSPANDASACQQGSLPSARPLRLALVTTELAVGGAERCLVNLAVGLRQTGRFTPHVYSLAPPPPSGRDRLVSRLLDERIPVEFLGATAPRHAPATIFRLYRHFRRQRPDVVQTFLYHANIVGCLAARAAGVRATVSGIRVADPRRRRHQVERLLASRVRKIVCVSQSVAAFCRDQVGLPADKLTVVANGINLSPFESASPADLAPWHVPLGSAVLLCVGRLHEQKGLDWLLPALSPVLRKRPDTHLLVVGDGPQRGDLAALATDLQLDRQIHFTGWRPDVPELLAASRLLLLPSRWEGMPNVVLEAMAAARPVLAARVSGVSELLGPGQSDQSFEPLETAEFVRKLDALLGDAALRGRLAAANQQRARRHFSLPAMCAAYEQLYRSLVA